MHLNGTVSDSLRSRFVVAGLIVLAGGLAGCLNGRREPASAFRIAPANVLRLEAPHLPAKLYSYAASGDSAVTRLVARGQGGLALQGGDGGRGGGGGGGGRGGGGRGGGGRGGGGRGAGGGGGRSLDNTPVTNPTTDAGATLGRVLFYDRQLSVNDRVSCASCHVQAFGFADTARLSRGFSGGLTRRHSMALANARLYANGRFFWDERASTLEVQVLMPVQDPVEMGMALPVLEKKLAVSPYYGPLFRAAFGTPEITSDRVARALAQFVRSLVSANARFDRSAAANEMNAQEREGLRLFTGQAGCARCHAGNALAGDAARNTGLDSTITDNGAGQGRFKVPSLRNVAVRPPYMHDGRFTTLAQVVEHYNSGVQSNPALDQRLRSREATPRGLGLSAAQKEALVAYLQTLTDAAFLNAEQFSDPFLLRKQR